jgi:hypothetical protein
MRKITLDDKYIKTYKKSSTLEKALTKLNLPESVSWLESWTEQGRVTAVFTNIASNEKNGFYLPYIAQAGFKIVG